MKFLRNIALTCLTVALGFFPAGAHGDDPVVEEPTGIKQGEVAPFAGVLFPTVTAAQLLADLEASTQRCEAATELAVSEAVNRQQLLLDTCNSNLQIRTEMYESRLQGMQDYNTFLEQRLTKKKISPEWTFIIGIATGVGVTLASGYAIHEIATQ